MKPNFRKALALSPHTDDAIIGAGALMHKLSKEGCEVIYVVFSVCDDTLEGTRFKSHEIAREDKKAASIIGVNEVIHYNFTNKHLEDSRQDILDVIYNYRNDREVELVIAPFHGDLHQDHKTVAQEAMRMTTRHPITLIQYPIIGTSGGFLPNILLPVTKEEAEIKLRALESYKTQFELRNGWFNLDNFWAEMRSNGVLVNAEFAEAFRQVKGTWNLG